MREPIFLPTAVNSLIKEPVDSIIAKTALRLGDHIGISMFLGNYLGTRESLVRPHKWGDRETIPLCVDTIAKLRPLAQR